MSAIAGYLGGGEKALLAGMAGLLKHRGRGGKVLHSGSGHGLAALADEPGGAHVAKQQTIACTFEGILLNAEELRDKFGAAKNATCAEIVLLGFRRYREEIFAMLDGPMSAAIVDGDTLYVVRDALGEKPMYHTQVGGTVLFASEIKAFLAHAKFRVVPSMASLNKLLVFSFIPGEHSMFEGVLELPPAHYLVVRKGGEPHVRPYWDLKEASIEKNERYYIDRIRELVVSATKKRLGKEKKVSAFLSGGIDSSAVVAVLAKLGADVTCFSAGFGHGQPNELMYARMVAQRTGVKHEVITVEPEDFLDLLPNIMWNLDDPLCDCITVPNYILAREAAKNARLVFNGEGGDPLFGGPKNKFLILGEWYSFLGEYDRARAYLSSYHKFFDYLGDLYSKDMMKKTGGEAPLLELVRPYLDNPSIKHFLNRLMHVNIKLKGGQNILVKVDKMLSANGVVASSPLFDRKLTEFSFAIPPPFKRKGDVEKYVFKKAMEDTLPRAVVYRKKVGMGVPLNYWFKVTKLRDYTADLLLSKTARERGYFNSEFVEGLVMGNPPKTSIGQNRTGELTWMLLATELWHRVFYDDQRARRPRDVEAVT